MGTELVVTTPRERHLAGAIESWLRSAERRSRKTYLAYRDTLASFRGFLQGLGHDLDAPRGLLRVAAQEWAATPRGRDGRAVANATYNQRLACASAFYGYAIKNDLLPGPNPLLDMGRLRADEYQHAVPLAPQLVRRRLAEIDRSTPTGKRDHALLLVALNVGRRLSEMRDMSIEDLTWQDGRATVVFPRAKGGKTMRDELSAPVSAALADYLATRPEASGADPVWVSYSNKSRGRRLSVQAIEEICFKRLGVSRFHTLRHTFAHEMERAGAPVSVIQARLGHASLDTTGRYLATLGAHENPYADQLAAVFGA